MPHALRCRRCRRFARLRDGKCVKCDGVPIALPLLPPMAVLMTRYCLHCGRPFECYGGSPKRVCSPRCNSARWRAIRMLTRTSIDV